jgi:predicted nucleotidyltransferase component of viral defense system
MDLDEVRRVTITALFADDLLMQKFVLKGGNALKLVYGLSTRTSLDLDLSLDNDFDDFEEAKGRLFRSLKDRFDAAGYIVFDEKLEPKPKILKEGQNALWGGYQLAFKLIEKAKYSAAIGDLRMMQRTSLVVGPDQQRVFTVDLSKNEYTKDKSAREFDDFEIYVYTLDMIAVEKLRALCQQMEEYPHRTYGKPRARDFYDIHRIVSSGQVILETEANRELMKAMFAVKEVPLTLLEKLPAYREFHRPDWLAVTGSVSVAEKLEDFDFYFDFVLAELEKLKSLWGK